MRGAAGLVAVCVLAAGCQDLSSAAAKNKARLDPFFIGIWVAEKAKRPADKQGEREQPKNFTMTIEIRADGTATEKDAITDLPLESGIVPFVTISRQSTWSFADGILFLHTQKVEVEGKPDAKTKSEFADVKQDIVSQRGQSQSLRVLKVDENTFDANGNDPGTIRLHRQG